jgi:ssDNA-binding Zn-finger/Zn-ribbon topoisomerase 1
MDDDVYDGDTFEGVAWYCDRCGTLLNKQVGFSDSYGSWTCTECYHTNSINVDEIYESEDEYNNRVLCPNCNANIRKQRAYYGYEDD